MSDKVRIIIQSSYSLCGDDGALMSQGSSYIVKRTPLINSYLETGLVTEVVEAEEDKPNPAKSTRKPVTPAADNPQENSNG
jgi:hypothetical protein